MWSCTNCEKSFQTETGLKIHRTKMHSQNPNSTTAAKPTKPLPQSNVAMTTERPSSCKRSSAANNDVNAVTETQSKAKQSSQHNDDEDDVSPNDPAAICSICGKQNKNERGLKQHMSRSHGVSSSTSAAAATSANYCAASSVLTCEVCGMQCKSPAGLKRHQSSTRCQGAHASGVRNASVTDSSYKQSPIKSTEFQKDTKPNAAAARSNYSTSNSSDMIQCKYCDKLCKGQRGLKQHLSRTHNIALSTTTKSDKPRKVDEEEIFDRLSNDHPVFCQICNRQCKNLRGLKRHHVSVHGNGTPVVPKLSPSNSLQMSNEREAVFSSVLHVESKAKTKIEQYQTTESTNNKAGNVRTEQDRVKVKVERGNSVRSLSNAHGSFKNEDSDEDDFSRTMFDLPVQADADMLKTKRNQTQDVSNEVDYKIRSLILALNGEDSQSLLTWTKLNAGSKYENTKILKPDECDVMFTCRIKGVVVEQSEVPGFYRARWETPVLNELSCLTATKGKQQFVDPKLFLQHFRDIVNYCNRTKILKIDDVQKETSPGVKAVLEIINYTSDLGSKTYCDVDLTPCIEFDGWPQEGRTDRPSWIPADTWKQACAKFHLVPKPHPSEQATAPGQCTLWRMSFSYAEKTVLRAADCSANQKYRGNAQTCRKDLIRQLKLDLERWHRKHEDDVIPDISSYIMKMIALQMYDKYSAPSCWLEDIKLLDMHLEVLQKLHYCFSFDGESKPQLRHYFLPSYNVLDHLLLTADRRKQCKIICRMCKETIDALEIEKKRIIAMR